MAREATNMGGPNQRFETTEWTVLAQAQTDDETKRREILDRVMSKYWKPVYCYLRRKGHSDADAKDLTQGFLHEVVLGRDLIGQADRSRGRFRTLLLTALGNYARSAYRATTAKKRNPPKPMFRLDVEDPDLALEATSGTQPQDAFNYAWASALLDRVLAQVKHDCLSRGQEVHWAVFAAHVLRPIMENTAAPSLSELCAKLGVQEESTASNMIVTVKRKFRSQMLRSIRDEVTSDMEVEQELQDLMDSLGARL